MNQEVKYNRRLVALLSAATLAAALSACGTLGGDSADNSPQEFKKNRTIWALPLDQFQYHSDLAVFQATQLIERDCMKAHGYEDFPIIPVNLDAPPSESESPGGQRLFNVPLAEKWGYRKAPSKQVNLYEWMNTMADYERQASEAEKSQLSACAEEASKAIWEGFDQSGLQRAAAYSMDQDPRESPSVKSATKRWRECMAPMGLPNLPPDPLEMIGIAVKMPSKEGSEYSQDLDSMVYAEGVPESEIRIATADAKCRESSGYAEAMYETQFQSDRRAYQEHEDDLQRIKEQNDDFAEHLNGIISKYS